jgi:glycerophosphoryl diester phosphodiesterase
LVLAGLLFGCGAAPEPVGEPLGCVPPLLFGHRGTPLLAPENTLEAFAYAADSGGDGLEVDVRMTADAQLVVLHDAGLERTTGQPGRVSDYTLEQVQALDAGSWFDPSFAGAHVPSVAEVLDVYADGEQLFLWDLKELAAAEQLVDEVQARGLEARSLWSSWTPSILARIRERLPLARTALYTDHLDDLNGLDPATIPVVRVPKDLEADVDVVESIAAMGFGTAISGSLISWQTEERALTEIGLVNNMELTWQRRVERKPAQCP